MVAIRYAPAIAAASGARGKIIVTRELKAVFGNLKIMMLGVDLTRVERLLIP